MAEKPWVYNTMLIDAITKEHMKVLISDLVPFQFYDLADVDGEDHIMCLEIDEKIEELTDEKYLHFILAITDDPFTESAGDWVDLGYGRIRVQMSNLERTFYENKTILKCKREDFKLEILLPERSI